MKAASLSDLMPANEEAAQELAWETHPNAMRGLRCMNFLVAAAGIFVLALVGNAIAAGSGTVDTLAPFIAVGTAISLVGLLGLAGTKKPKLLKVYWLATFFGSVLAAWMLAYAAFNFSTIEHQAMLHFEKNWGTLVVALPDELKDVVPVSCGGNKGSEIEVELVVMDPDGGSVTPCTAPETEAECRAAAESHCLSAGSSAYGFAGDYLTAGCYYYPAEHAIRPNEAYFGTDEAATAWPELSDDGQVRLCVEESIGSTCERRLQEESTELHLGSPAEFETQCWNTIKGAIMKNLEIVVVCIGVALVMQLLCIYCTVQVLTASEAVSLIRGAIDAVMTVVGLLLLLLGLGWLYELALWTETETESGLVHLIVPVIAVGALMFVLGVVFGCTSASNRKCAAIASMIYVFLFVVLAGMGYACIAYEDTIRERAKQDGAEFLDSLCDQECYDGLYASMLASRVSSQCEVPSPGDGECQEDYGWISDRLQDPACNATAPNTISEACSCPCAVAKERSESRANAKEATKEYIISTMTDVLGMVGWVCILVSVIMLIEALCHYYHKVHNDLNSSYQGLDDSREADDDILAP